MKSSILVKFFIGATCLFTALFFISYLLNWNSFETIQELMSIILPFFGIGIVCLWGFGFTADNQQECIKLEEKVADKSRRLVEKAMERKHNTIAQYNVLMNMSSRANRDYYNVLRRAC